MTIPNLPIEGDEDWYDYAQSLDAAARTIASKETPGGAQAKADAAFAAANAAAPGLAPVQSVNGQTGAVVISGGGTATTDASQLTSGILSVNRLGTSSIPLTKLDTDVATQAELDAVAASAGGDTLRTVAASGTTQTLDAAVATVQDVTLTANCIMTLAAPSGAKSLTVILRQDATGSRTVTWPTSVRWPAAVTPALSTAPGREDVLSFLTTDGGASWRGFVAGTDFTTPSVPGAPTLTATGTADAINLGWTAPATNGSAITGYRLYRGTTSGSLSLYQALGLVTSYVDTVTAGVPYYYRLSAVNGVGEGPQSIERTATRTSGLVTLAADDFTAADGLTAVIGSGATGRTTPTGAKVWTRAGAGSATAGIIGNQAYKSDNQSFTPGIYVETSQADVTVTCDITLGTTVSNAMGLLLRFADTSNYLRLIPDASGWYLQRIAAGAQSNIGSGGGAIATGSGPHTMQVVMAGSNITVKRNGSSIFTATDSTAAITAATKHGLWLNQANVQGTEHRFDNFSVTQP